LVPCFFDPIATLHDLFYRPFIGEPYGGQIIIGHHDGTASAFDEYGRRPWEKRYRGKGVGEDWNTFHRFQGEFARLFGPYRRGRAFNAMNLDNERDSDDFHQYHLNLEKEWFAKRHKKK